MTDKGIRSKWIQLAMDALNSACNSYWLDKSTKLNIANPYHFIIETQEIYNFHTSKDCLNAPNLLLGKITFEE